MSTTTEKTSVNNEIEKIKKNSLEKAGAIIQESKQLVERCNAIVIKDVESLSLATQVLTNANAMYKKADEARLVMQRPYMAASEAIRDAIKEAIITPLENAIEAGKKKVKKWNEDQKAIAEKLRLENEKKFAYFTSLKTQLEGKVKECKTPKHCDDLIASINNNWPEKYDFGQYKQDALDMKANFILILETRSLALKESMSDNISSEIVIENLEKSKKAEAKIEEQTAQIAEKKDIIQNSITTIKSVTRNTWKFEVIDESKLPRQFLSVDESKIRKYLSNHKDEMKDGIVIGGVKFFIDETVAL